MDPRRVALFTIVTERAVVLVFVAIHAIVFTQTVLMPRVAAYTIAIERLFAVESYQRELRVDVVIEGGVAFSALNVTLGARRVRELSLMCLFVGMAARTSTFRVFELSFPLVTARAGLLRVFA
jgi:hypothetical protein